MFSKTYPQTTKGYFFFLVVELLYMKLLTL